MGAEDLPALLGPGVITRQAAPDLAHLAELFPQERDVVAKAVPKRQAEFATARVLARQALDQLGVARQSLAPNPDRSPTWPPGVVGSITHTKGYCGVAVAPATAVRSVGIDAELDDPLADGLLPMICTRREQDWLASLRPAERGVMAKVVFSAKEAFYKCQHPLTKAFLGFVDVQVELAEPGRFNLTVLRGLAHEEAALKRMRGRYARRDGRVITAVVLRHAAAEP